MKKHLSELVKEAAEMFETEFEQVGRDTQHGNDVHGVPLYKASFLSPAGHHLTAWIAQGGEVRLFTITTPAGDTLTLTGE